MGLLRRARSGSPLSSIPALLLLQRILQNISQSAQTLRPKQRQTRRLEQRRLGIPEQLVMSAIKYTKLQLPLLPGLVQVTSISRDTEALITKGASDKLTVTYQLTLS